jgi:hypothetical protein
MVRPTVTKAECEAALVETVRQEQEKAATRAKSLPEAYWRGDGAKPTDWRVRQYPEFAQRDAHRVLAGRRRSSRSAVTRRRGDRRRRRPDVHRAVNLATRKRRTHG